MSTEWLVIIAVVLLIVSSWITTYLRIQAKKQAYKDSMTTWKTSVPNVTIAFYKVDDEVINAPWDITVPHVDETDIINRVHTSLPYAWGEFVDRLSAVDIIVWFVRDLEQRVNFGSRIGVRWCDLPGMVGVAESEEGAGYGGLHNMGNIYVATYHPDRSPLLLYVHELTHLATGIHEHSEEFLDVEKRLVVSL